MRPCRSPSSRTWCRSTRASCSPATSRRSAALGQAELDRLYAERYGGEPFIDLVARPPGVRDVRETNICAIHVHADERTGKLLVFAAIDNLWKGTSSQAVANLNLMFGLDEAGGSLR